MSRFFRHIFTIVVILIFFCNLKGVEVPDRSDIFTRSLLRYKFLFYEESLKELEKTERPFSFYHSRRTERSDANVLFFDFSFEDRFSYLNFIFDGMWFLYQHIPLDVYYNFTRKYYFNDIHIVKIQPFGDISLNLERLTQGKTFFYLKIPLE